MDQPYHTPPPSFSLAPPRPSTASVFPYQHEVPAQRRQLQQQQNVPQQHHASAADTANTANTQSILADDGIPFAVPWVAITSFQDIPVPTILAWLGYLRSSLRGEAFFNLNQPPPQHYEALSALTDCSNELVQIWLNAARSPRQYWFIV